MMGRRGGRNSETGPGSKRSIYATERLLFFITTREFGKLLEILPKCLTEDGLTPLVFIQQCVIYVNGPRVFFQLIDRDR